MFVIVYSLQVSCVLGNLISPPTKDLQHPVKLLTGKTMNLTTQQTPCHIGAALSTLSSAHAYAYAGVNAHIVTSAITVEGTSSGSGVERFTFGSGDWYTELAASGFSSDRWTTMNYGWAADCPSGLHPNLVLEQQDALAWSSVQLYWQLLRDVPVADNTVLEVGCGRGGGGGVHGMYWWFPDDCDRADVLSQC